MKTVQNVLDAMAYYIANGGYYEKKDGTAKYLTRDVSNFAANAGGANYTYGGKECGINPGAWCAMFVSTCIKEALGSAAAAKEAMWGVPVYYNCAQLWDAAPSTAKHWSWYQLSYKGRSGTAYTPQPGDVIIFTDNGTARSHTGMVYAVDGGYVYTYEGNSGNMARKRSYSLKSSYIYGYVTLNLEAGDESGIKKFQRWLGVTADGDYGPKTKAAAIRAHQKCVNAKYGAGIAEDGEWGPETYYATQNVQQGDDGDDVTVLQGMLYCNGQDPCGLDGGFGKNTLTAVCKFQSAVTLNATGIADRYTWAKLFGYTKPMHTTLKKGRTGAEVKYLQRKLTDAGYTLATDGDFGPATELAVKTFQKDKGVTADGIVGPITWDLID